MTEQGAPTPTAQGELNKTPFLHVLLSLADKGWSGTLVLWGEDGSQDRLLIAGANLIRGVLSSKASALDRGTLPLFSRGGGMYAFYRDIDLVGASGLAQQVELRNLALASIRGPSRDDVIERVFTSLGNAEIIVKPDAKWDALRFIASEELLVKRVRSAQLRLQALIDGAPNAQQARRLVYVLSLLRMVEFRAEAGRQASKLARATGAMAAARGSLQPPDSSTSVPVPIGAAEPAADLPLPGDDEFALVDVASDAPVTNVSSPPTGVAVPDGLSAEDAAFWAEVHARRAQIENENFFEMLGVTKDAAPDVLRRAYFALAKRWHADRLTGALEPLRRPASEVFSFFTQAFETLDDAEKRKKYLAELAAGGGTPAADKQMARILTAAFDVQKAAVLVKQRDFAGALLLLDGALQANDDDGDAHALRALALLSFGNERLADAEGASARAVQIVPDGEQSNYSRALVLRRKGDELGAIEHYRKVLAANPKNLEAQREIRVFDMRAKDANNVSSKAPHEAPPSKGGLFAKLFKK